MMKIALVALLAVASTVSVAYAFEPETLRDCTTETEFNDLMTCHKGLVATYVSFWEIHESNVSTYLALQERYEQEKTESALWKAKYTALLGQQGNSTIQSGNSTIQDQIANLTARVSAVETKADRNESLIHIVHNMLRTAQADIADIYLKINSVR